jgi:hypothetical protein
LFLCRCCCRWWNKEAALGAQSVTGRVINVMDLVKAPHGRSTLLARSKQSCHQSHAKRQLINSKKEVHVGIGAPRSGFVFCTEIIFSLRQKQTEGDAIAHRQNWNEQKGIYFYKKETRFYFSFACARSIELNEPVEPRDNVLHAEGRILLTFVPERHAQMNNKRYIDWVVKSSWELVLFPSAHCLLISLYRLWYSKRAANWRALDIWKKLMRALLSREVELL